VTDRADVVIVGGGPAGLRAAAELAPQHSVVVLEREAHAGGIPRHSDHPGYGLRDRGRFMSGPRYALMLVEQAVAAGAQIRTSSTVTGWEGPLALAVTSPQGRYVIEGSAVLLATGARERPRPARWIPGDRPMGVMTTGQLQQSVHLQHRRVGTRAVIIGSELVSWSAVLTLREAGCRTVAMVTRSARQESYALASWAGRAAFRVPVMCNTDVVSIHGGERVTGLTVRCGERISTIDCDLVITSGDWISDHELARMRDLDIDRGSLAPVCDTSLRLSADGVFGAGNLLHPVDTADVCALDGAHAARSMATWLGGARAPAAAVDIHVGDGFAWVSPGLWRGEMAPARQRFAMWPTEARMFPKIIVRQNGAEISRRRVAWPAAPGRIFRLPASHLSAVRSDGGPIEISLR
jgi:thioredoxin reductase